MTARSLLWLVLGIVGLPLLIEGGSGCGFQSPGASPILDNAYTCGCRCAASPVSRTVTIVTNSDDAEQDGANVQLGGNDLHLGANIVGLRFTGVGIPRGATVTSAAAQVRANASDSVATNLRIVAEFDPDAKTFENTDNNLSNRGRTLTSVPWSPGPWITQEAGPDERTPDLSALIQEVAGEANWTV